MDQAAKGAWTVGRFAETDVKVHWGFALLVVWFVVAAFQVGHDPRSLAMAVLLLALTSACLIAHEFGHVLAARAYGIRTHEVTLLPIGALSRLAGTPATAEADLVIAAAGPSVSALLAGLFLVGAWFSGDRYLDLSLVSHASLMGKLFWVNVMIFAINMLPALPMDGGKILRAGLTLVVGDRIATRIALWTSYGTVGLFVALAFTHDLVFAVMAIMVLMYAVGESGRLKAASLSRTLRVADALAPEWLALAHDELILHRLDDLLQHTQREFPVLRESVLVGMMGRADLARGAALGQATVTVETVMQREFLIAHHDEVLAVVLTRLETKKLRAIAVLRDGAFLGMLIRDDGEQEVLNHAAQMAALHSLDKTTKKAG